MMNNALLTIAIVTYSMGFWIPMFMSPMLDLFHRGSTIFGTQPVHTSDNGTRAIYWWEWIFFLLTFVAFSIGEGYVALHKRFCAIAVRRTFELARVENVNALDARYVRNCRLLAPFFVAAMFHAQRSRLVKTWVTIFGVIFLVIIVIHLPSPWREFIDFSVAAAMLVGTSSLVFRTIQGFSYFGGKMPLVDSEYPIHTPFAGVVSHDDSGLLSTEDFQPADQA